ncbi:hypothetical protein HDU93_006177, partial [Gonapodya sp. JEL0774]
MSSSASVRPWGAHQLDEHPHLETAQDVPRGFYDERDSNSRRVPTPRSETWTRDSDFTDASTASRGHATIDAVPSRQSALASGRNLVSRGLEAAGTLTQPKNRRKLLAVIGVLGLILIVGLAAGIPLSRRNQSSLASDSTTGSGADVKAQDATVTVASAPEPVPSPPPPPPVVASQAAGIAAQDAVISQTTATTSSPVAATTVAVIQAATTTIVAPAPVTTTET